MGKVEWIGYKVLYIEGENFFSSTKSFNDWSYADRFVIYKLGEWVSPKRKCGPLCVFNNINLANSYKDIHYRMRRSFKTFRCVYLASKKNCVFYKDEFGVVFHGPYLSGLPKGTVLADRVKLIEEC